MNGFSNDEFSFSWEIFYFIIKRVKFEFNFRLKFKLVNYYHFEKKKKTFKMAYKGGQKLQKVMVQPIVSHLFILINLIKLI